MSSIPIVTAALTPLAIDGIKLYKDQVVNLDLNDLIQSFFLGRSVVQSGPVTTGSSVTIYVYSDVTRITATSLPAGLVANSDYKAGGSSVLSGTPTTVGTTTVLFKVEIYDYNFSSNTSSGSGTPHTYAVQAVGYISVPITVDAVPTSVTPEVAPSVILPSIINAVKGSYLNFALTAAAATYPLYWTAAGLPPGLNIEGANIEGSPTETGTTTATLTLRYKPTESSGFTTETKSVAIVVTAAPVTDSSSSAVTFLSSEGIDLFVDLQNMALSLDTPKPEQFVSEGSTLINASEKQLVIKPSQILNLNVRFTKGQTIVDPDPASMRFGVGTIIGGPLLMIGSTFTKVGAGSSAYFKMRITSDSSEFSALQKEYYDEDRVEQTGKTSENYDPAPLSGLCELEFTTGAGATLATFRSDNLPVTIRRSLLAGI
jgi:hypothetical protein